MDKKAMDKYEIASDNDVASKDRSPDGAFVSNAEDPAAPSREVSSKKQSLSDIFTIFCAGAALVSDGYQNNLMLVEMLLFAYRSSFRSNSSI